MSRPRLLIPVTYQFSVRYVLHTGLLERLNKTVQPVVALSWEDDALRQELAAVGSEVVSLPSATFGSEYRRNRQMLDMWHLSRLGSPSTAIDRRRTERLRDVKARRMRLLRRLKYRSLLSIPGADDRLLAADSGLVRTDTNLDTFTGFLRDAEIDAVLSVTPYHQAEELVLRAAKLADLPCATSIISFDNLTTRGWIPVAFDRYWLWNTYNRAELLRSYDGVDPASVGITGAPQFDFYADGGAQYCWDEQRWRTELGLPPDRPVVLFAAGPPEITEQEPHVLGQLDAAIAAGRVPGDPIVLLRRHPMDTAERWRSVLDRASHVHYDDPWALRGDPKYSVPQRGDIEKLVSTLRYSAVHLSTSSTMTVDGAALDRPQVGLAYDDRPGRPFDRTVKELYQREHWLPIERSGGLTMANNPDQLVDAIADGLRDPGARSAQRRRMVEEIVTYTDGRATERLALGVEEWL